MNKIFRKISKLILIFLFLITLAMPVHVFALSAGGIGILPANPDDNNPQTKSWFIYNLDRGEEKEDAVNVFNNSDDEVVVKVYPVDATTTGDGNFTLVDEFAEQVDIGAWVQLFTKEIGLKPHEVKKIPFVIKVPDNADVGDHMGGIIIQEVSRGPAGTSREGMTMSIITRIGARIYLTVPGEKIEDISIADYGFLFISRAKSFLEKFLNLNYITDFYLEIKNEGNVRIEPEIKINIKNIFGQTAGDLSGKIGVVFPKKSSIIHSRWEKPLFFGRYTAAVSVNYGTNKTTDVKKIIIWAVPYKLLTILAGLIVLIVLLRLVVMYFREAAKEKMAIYVLSKKETIQEVAEKFKVNWAKLARINKIKQPFELKKGQKLFIPTNRRNNELIKVLLEKKVLELSIQEKLGKGKQSIFFKIHRGKKSLQIMFISLIILLVGGGITWFFIAKGSKQQVIIQELSNQTKASDDQSRTKTGELKRSEINLAIDSNSSTSDNVEKLIKKLKFVGFDVEKTSGLKDKAYQKTTFVYQPGKIESAIAVQTALDLNSEDVELKEVTDLRYDVAIAYFIGEIFDLTLPELTEDDIKILETSDDNRAAPSTDNQANKTNITVAVLNGGAAAGTAGQVAAIIKGAGYTQTTATNADNFNYQGVNINYGAGFAQAAADIKNLLSSDYPNITLTEKNNLLTNLQVILGS